VDVKLFLVLMNKETDFSFSPLVLIFSVHDKLVLQGYTNR